MTIEQLERAKVLQACINNEENNIERMERMGECQELVIIHNSEEFQKAIKGMYFSTNNPAPRYVSGDEKGILVSALNKPRQEHIEKLKEEFKEL